MDEPFAGNDVFNREDFYKVLLGILNDSETVLLSTHLLEEVKDFVSRAVLLRRGRLVGDCLAEDLEEQGMDLMDYVKKSYGYEAGRVSQTLKELADEEQGGGAS
jgi:ABC-2 type transport system ATP-binding protein